MIVNKSVKTTDSNIAKGLKFFQSVDLTNVDSGEDAESDLAVLVVDVSQGASRKGDLLTQVGHVDRSVERGVRVAVVQVHDVDTTGLGTLFHQCKEQVLCLDGLTRDVRVCLVVLVHSVELRLSESVIETGDVTRREQRDLTVG